MRPHRFPPGWDEERVQKVLAYYEEQTEDEAVAEDEVAFEDATQSAWVKRGSVRALAFSPDGHILVFGNDNGSVGVVVTPDRSSKWQESQLIFAHRMGVTALEFCGAPSVETQQGISRRTCDHNTFVSAGNDGRVKFWPINRLKSCPLYLTLTRVLWQPSTAD